LVAAFADLFFDAVFADPDRLSLFTPSLEDVRPILTISTAATFAGTQPALF